MPLAYVLAQAWPEADQHLWLVLTSGTQALGQEKACGIQHHRAEQKEGDGWGETGGWEVGGGQDCRRQDVTESEPENRRAGILPACQVQHSRSQETGAGHRQVLPPRCHGQ